MSKSTVKYFRPDHGQTAESAYECQISWPEDCAAQIAEECAEDFHGQHDGWEAHWPIKFTLIMGEKNLGTFEVEREAAPQFWAKEVR